MDPAMAAEGFTKLTHEIEAIDGGVTKLTVIHELEGAPKLAFMLAGGREAEGAGGGWAWVLSDLKTLLESGSHMAASAFADNRRCWPHAPVPPSRRSSPPRHAPPTLFERHGAGCRGTGWSPTRGSRRSARRDLRLLRGDRVVRDRIDRARCGRATPTDRARVRVVIPT